DAGLSLSAFDYEASARTTIEATVDEPGTILVHGRLLSDIASRLPNAPIQVEVEEDGGIALTCGSARFTLSSMPVQEYPAIPEVSGDSGLVPADDFGTAISQVAFAASRDDVTPVLTGVQLEVTGTQLSLVATDRYRVALRQIPWDGGAAASDDATTALVPARTLTEVGKTFAHGGDISISFSGSGDREIIAFTSANKTVTSLLIKGNFPPVRRLFPEQTEHHAVVNTADLAEAVRRVSLVLDRSAPLRFTFTAEGVSMDASGTEQARASESVDATLVGEDVTLGLNPQYLLEALSAVRSEFTRITFTSSDNANKLSPVLITPQTSVDKAGEDSFRYLLQPNLLLR
ncbi:MAG: DNA polymerase III subunit beta, partial [Microbacterium sp.]|uniref:DNA polymerase III subunit beta n=1 Tax=Microbacterium sp. TaxID=51671 RepID=UPI001AD33023